MRVTFVSLAAMAVLVLPAFAQEPPQTPTPFRIERGTALPPPTALTAAQPAPPEGAGPGGLDFGPWRSAEAEGYGFRFAAAMRERYAGQAREAAEADLEANGFACAGTQPLQCRLAVMDQGCAKEWYVVFERGRAEPIAGFDAICPRGGR